MPQRKPLSKKIRFEIFKRDSFKCQYCGKSAPEVILHVDHIKPVKEGGTNDMTNLITSCADCNLGKKDIPLDDNSMMEKQKKQLEELNERRQQLELMMQWREGLMEIENEKANIVKNRISSTYNCGFTENGMREVKQWIKKYSLEIVLDSIDVSAKYLSKDPKQDGRYTGASLEKAFESIPKICTNKVKDQEKPYLKDLYYMRGIIKNRLGYYDYHNTLVLLEKAYLNGASLEWLKELCLEATRWTYFRASLEQFWEGEDDE